MEPIYLPIDSKNKISYQFIHIDIDRKYGIACIFDFENQSPGKFTITHIKEIFMDSSHKEHKVNIIEVSKELGFSVGNFARRPIEGLVAYHIKKIE